MYKLGWPGARDSQSPASLTVELPEGRKPDKRLSLAKCRELMGSGCDLSDTELDKLCDQMYAIADILTTEFVQRMGKREEPASVH